MSSSGKVMAVDVGSKRVGVAICDPLGITTRSLGYVSGTGREEFTDRVAKLAAEHMPEKIVVGIPVNMNGTFGPMADKAKKFVDMLKGKVSVPVETIDERLSTAESQRILISADVKRKKRREVVDGMAACIILQKYLQLNRTEKDEEDEDF